MTLAPGATSSYAVYEDSGASVEYQRGVFVRTPIKATQTGDCLRVEIGPVQGSYPAMPKTRGYELRLPADWPSEKVTVNGAVVKKADATGKGGWHFEGNTLTTFVPVPATSTAAKVVVEVHRAAGSTVRRSQLDGFAGAMTRLRGAYEALWFMHPMADLSGALNEAMQTGDRLNYHPETAASEIARFHETLEKVQTGVNAMNGELAKLLASATQTEQDAQKQRLTEAMERLVRFTDEAGK